MHMKNLQTPNSKTSNSDTGSSCCQATVPSNAHCWQRFITEKGSSREKFVIYQEQSDGDLRKVSVKYSWSYIFIDNLSLNN